MMDVDFDALVEAARDATNKLGEQELWRAALNLPLWYFVANSDGDDAEPTIGVVEGAAHLLAFTDEQRAEEFSRRRAAQRGSRPLPVLNMEVADAVEYGQTLLNHNVEGVLVNNGAYSFQCGLIDLKDRFRRYAR